MQALSVRRDVTWSIFTTVPEWFFSESGIRNYLYYLCRTDVGVVQDGPFELDIERTEQDVAAFTENLEKQSSSIAEVLKRNAIDLTISDISSLGVLAGKKFGLPTVIVENFLWDFIYSGLNSESNQLKGYGKVLTSIARRADLHLRTNPFCTFYRDSIEVAPISRMFRTSRDEIRTQLGLAKEEKAILVSLGGVPGSYDLTNVFESNGTIKFIYHGADEKLPANVIRLEKHDRFYHPDLVNAVDGIVAKLGYSTLAEAINHRTVGCYVANRNNPEGEPLSKYVLSNGYGCVIDNEKFVNQEWVDIPTKLIEMKQFRAIPENGADQAADLILSFHVKGN
ncbi:MAG TPA: hypothetical protein PKD55_08885 [Bellilinea sp.]|nr:hypothetical protein [Bellilinea sp.]